MMGVILRHSLYSKLCHELILNIMKKIIAFIQSFFSIKNGYVVLDSNII